MTKELLKQLTIAYWEGYEARLNRKPLLSCPYKDASPAARLWGNGWVEAHNNQGEREKMSYVVTVWDNSGNMGKTVFTSGEHAYRYAKECRTPLNRTVKVGWLENTMEHWTRSRWLDKNHWSKRATASEFFPK